MDTSKLLKVWHYAGLTATGLGLAATQLQPLTSVYPKLAPIVAGIGGVSFFISSFMKDAASDKVVSAIINDPSSPTPQGFGIPVPIAPIDTSETLRVSNQLPQAVQAVAEAAVAQNVVDHANAVLSK
jgi:hypothetical protein